MTNILLIIITGILIFGVVKGVDVYGAFVEGAGMGISTMVKIFPYMVAIMVCINIFNKSGAVEILSNLLSPVLSLFNIPKETIPLIVLKPFSGGAALGALSEIYIAHGVDSHIAIVASVIAGSSESLFYTLSLYFGYVGVKNTRYTVLCGLLAIFCGVLGAILAVNVFF